MWRNEKSSPKVKRPKKHNSSLKELGFSLNKKMPRLHFEPKSFMRSLYSFGSHWAIILIALTVVLAGATPRPASSAIGGSPESRVRYRTIAELASLEYFNEDVVYDEVIFTVGENNDYIFKTGATATVISRNNRKETIEYSVKSGESVSSVAKDFGLSPDTLRYANKLSSNSLEAGKVLTIPPVDGVYVAVKTNDTLSTIANRYKISVDDIVKYNGLNKDEPIHSGNQLLIPGVVAPKASSGTTYSPSGNANSIPAFNPIASGGQFIWPTSTHTRYISQGYRAYHKALDLNRLNGWGIYASSSGIVRTYSTRYGYGNYIDINHGDGWLTRYGHLSEFKVKSGDYVQQGQLIGIMGSTGRSTGPHLHFEIRYNGAPLNPLSYLPQ
jgi:murein DD-endopeptidase MepM/ murein hydrolase activator NlpD